MKISIKNLYPFFFATFFYSYLTAMVYNHRVDVRTQEKRDEIRSLIIKKLDHIKKKQRESSAVFYQSDLYEKSGYSLLHLAVGARLHDLVKELIEKGADVNALPAVTNDNNDSRHPYWMPLRIACYNGDFESCKLLLQNGAKQNVKVECRLSCNICNSQDNEGSELHSCLRKGHFECLKLLLEHALSYEGKGAKVVIPAYLSWSRQSTTVWEKEATNALNLASSMDRIDIVDYLLDFRARYHEKHGFSRAETVMESQNYIDDYSLIMTFGVATGLVLPYYLKKAFFEFEEDSYLPLEEVLLTAACSGKRNVVMKLVDAGAEIKCARRANIRRCPLLHVIDSDSVCYFKLKARGATLLPGYDWEYLGTAVSRNSLTIIDDLLTNQKVSIHKKEEDGSFFDVEQTEVSEFKNNDYGFLMVGNLSTWGNTVLHRAAGNELLMKELVKRGAYVDIENSSGATPLQYAMAHKYYPNKRRILESFMKIGAHINTSVSSPKNILNMVLAFQGVCPENVAVPGSDFLKEYNACSALLIERGAFSYLVNPYPRKILLVGLRQNNLTLIAAIILRHAVEDILKETKGFFTRVLWTVIALKVRGMPDYIIVDHVLLSNRLRADVFSFFFGSFIKKIGGKNGRNYDSYVKKKIEDNSVPISEGRISELFRILLIHATSLDGDLSSLIQDSIHKILSRSLDTSHNECKNEHCSVCLMKILNWAQNEPIFPEEFRDPSQSKIFNVLIDHFLKNLREVMS